MSRYPVLTQRAPTTIPPTTKARPLRPSTRARKRNAPSILPDVFTRLDKADDEGFSSSELHTIDPKGEIWSSDRTLLHHSLL